MTNNTRLCESCGHPLRRDNTVGVCHRKPCQGAYVKRWRQLNPDQREKGRVRTRQWFHDNYVRATLMRAKSRAKRRGLEFSIVDNDVPDIPSRCPVLGIPLTRGDGERHDGSPSLDRIDSSRGYVVGNVHWISWRANNIKGDATVDELVQVATYFDQLRKA